MGAPDSPINVEGPDAAGEVLAAATAIIVQGPPAVPAGNTAQVGRSTLQIDCGTGYTAQATWYFPTGPQPPTRLIYFQHGILASDAYYNATAAELAENNDAIVVAPTITSNPFACDGCQLAGDQMHAAVAQLFLDQNRTALLASAKAAGFQGAALPTDFVLAGHSEGGQLAAGAAGYFEQFATDDQTRHELVGVLLFDAADDNGILPSNDGALTRALRQIPTDIPVLNIAATPNFLDAYGDANAALEAARPGQFNGVQLVGGQHSDAFQTSNPIIQFVVSVATGFSAPQNVDAVQVLAQGWINDMYARTLYDPDLRTGIYGSPGSTVDVPTDAGIAQAYVLPAPATPPDALYPFYVTLRNLLLAANFDFATCAVPPGDPSASSADSIQLVAATSCGRGIADD